MSEDSRPSPLGNEMVAGLSAFCDALEVGEPIEKTFTVRRVHLDLNPRRYDAADVKNVRGNLKASRVLLARFLGVKVKTIRAWEDGTRRVPAIACRFLDEIVANPDLWERRLLRSSKTETGELAEP